MSKSVRMILVPVMLLLLAACSHHGSGRVVDRIEVARGTRLAAGQIKATFVMLPSKAQEGTQDYDRVAEQIARKVADQGLSRVTSPGEARYAVMFTYDAFEPYSAAMETYGKPDSDRHRSTTKASLDGRSSQVLRISIYDLSKPGDAEENVFGAEVRAITALDVTEAMINAAFRDFPGKTDEKFSLDLGQ